ncbi:hypothetical protein DFH29DRAFT_956408 [Suillus ampliporus]|nr:hypothetical protein DFH29DRAFT_956408 [Suillus ampliporus]
MPGSESSEMALVLRAPLGNLSSIRELFSSLTSISRIRISRRSPRGDDNLEQAEVYLRITEEQLDVIHGALRQATETAAFAEQITLIKDGLDEVDAWLNAVKIARGGRSTLKRTLQRLSNDDTTKDVMEAARELSQKAKRTSAIIVAESLDNFSSMTIETVPSSEYTTVPRDELTARTDTCGLYSDDDNNEELGSVRALRPRKSDVSTYSFHYWGRDAYSPPDISNQLPSQCRTSTEMRRQLLAVSSTDVEHVQDDDLPSDVRIGGIVIPLETSQDEYTAALVTEAASVIASQVNPLSEGNSFDDQVEHSGGSVGTKCSSTADSATDGDEVTPPSSSRLSEASSSSTPSLGQGSGNTYNITFNNSYFAWKSAIHTPTLNYGGSHNQGSSASSLQAQNKNPTVSMRSFPEAHPDEVNCGGKDTKRANLSPTEADGNSADANNSDDDYSLAGGEE